MGVYDKELIGMTYGNVLLIEGHDIALVMFRMKVYTQHNYLISLSVSVLHAC